MLLFRGHFDVNDPMHRFEALAVMLVPENPSSGVNGDAFKAAATFARENSPNEKTLAILGPSFSSSAVSLQTAMHNTPLQYVIRTGSATVPEAWKLLQEETGSFAATVRDDDQASQALFKHLDLMGEWRKQGRVAILSESGTLYGAHASSFMAPQRVSGHTCDGHAKFGAGDPFAHRAPASLRDLRTVVWRRQDSEPVGCPDTHIAGSRFTEHRKHAAAGAGPVRCNQQHRSTGQHLPDPFSSHSLS
jgi:hypothetical protein